MDTEPVFLDTPAVVLSGRVCLSADRHLQEAIQLSYLARRRPPPRALMDIAELVHRCADQFRASLQAIADRGTAEHAGPGTSSCSGREPVRLTTREAAGIAGVSESYARRLARRGDVDATRSGQGGAWLIDAASWQVWLNHRKETNRKAA